MILLARVRAAPMLASSASTTAAIVGETTKDWRDSPSAPRARPTAPGVSPPALGSVLTPDHARTGHSTLASGAALRVRFTTAWLAMLGLY
jgi:hypothetical protein